MNRARLAAPGLVAATLLVWLFTSGLPWPARFFTTALAVPLPALAFVQLRMLSALGDSPIPRLPVYISTIISLWVLAFGAITAAAYSHFTAGLIGLRPLPTTLLMTWTVFGLSSALLLYAISRYFDVKESPLLYQLLPQSFTERAAFVLLSFTAGICEELVFRGFLIAALTAAFGSTPGAVAVSSLLFGLLHVYQGVIGVGRATLLGLVLALPFVATGSILPSVVIHILIDVIAGLWLRDPDPAHALH